MNKYYSDEQIKQTRTIDLLTYLQIYEPTNLVHVRGNTYCTREHDSLKISNGKWMWWSRGFGGNSALDYLIKVKGMSFIVNRTARKFGVSYRAVRVQLAKYGLQADPKDDKVKEAKRRLRMYQSLWR